MIYGAFLRQFFPSIIQKTPSVRALAGHCTQRSAVRRVASRRSCCDWSSAKLALDLAGWAFKLHGSFTPATKLGSISNFNILLKKFVVFACTPNF